MWPPQDDGILEVIHPHLDDVEDVKKRSPSTMDICRVVKRGSVVPRWRDAVEGRIGFVIIDPMALHSDKRGMIMDRPGGKRAVYRDENQPPARTTRRSSASHASWAVSVKWANAKLPVTRSTARLHMAWEGGCDQRELRRLEMLLAPGDAFTIDIEPWRSKGNPCLTQNAATRPTPQPQSRTVPPGCIPCVATASRSCPYAWSPLRQKWARSVMWATRIISAGGGADNPSAKWAGI